MGVTRGVLGVVGVELQWVGWDIGGWNLGLVGIGQASGEGMLRMGRKGLDSLVGGMMCYVDSVKCVMSLSR